jgi:hypothetical protein
MNFPPSILAQLQEQVVDRLKRDEYLAEISIMAEERKDLVQQIDLSLKKLGVVIVVQTVEANVTHSSLPGPVFDSLKFSVEVIENPLFNRSGSGTHKPALEIAVRIAQRLHHFLPPGSSGTIMCDSRTIQLAEDPQYLIYDVNFFIGEK